MIYEGITILDQDLKPRNITGIGGKTGKQLMDKIVRWAEHNNTKIVSVVRLVHPGEASAFGVDDIIKIGTPATGTANWGIWKVYGSVDTLPKLNPRGRHRYLDWKKETEEAAAELEKKHEFQKKAQALRKIGAGGGALTPDDIAQVEKSWNIEWKDGKYISKNPRKKEMKMGVPDKSPTISSVKKIMDEIDEKPSEWRFRMQLPSKFHEDSLRYGSKSITRGVRAVYGCPKDEWAPKLHRCKKGMVMQSLRLMRTVFKTKESAAKWISSHTKSRGE